jgi:transposase
MQYLATVLHLYMAADPATFGWKDLLSILGLILPILFGFIFYLLKRKSDAEIEARRTEIKGLQSQLDSMKDDAKSLDQQLRQATNDILGHQNSCSRRYVEQQKYESDARVQKGQIETMKKMLDTTTDMLESTQRLVEQILRSS